MAFVRAHAALFHVGLFLWLLGQNPPLTAIAAAGFLSLWFDLLTFAIPFNLGTLEGSRLLVFKALGSAALLGIAFGVAVRLAQLFWACFGLLNYPFLLNPQTRAKAHAHRLHPQSPVVRYSVVP